MIRSKHFCFVKLLAIFIGKKSSLPETIVPAPSGCFNVTPCSRKYVLNQNTNIRS